MAVTITTPGALQNLERRRQMQEALMQQALVPQGRQTGLTAIARALTGLVAGRNIRAIEEKELAAKKSNRQAIIDAFGDRLTPEQTAALSAIEGGPTALAQASLSQAFEKPPKRDKAFWVDVLVNPASTPEMKARARSALDEFESQAKAGADQLTFGNVTGFEPGSKGPVEGQKALAKSDEGRFTDRARKSSEAIGRRATIEQIRASAEGFRPGFAGDLRLTAGRVVDFLGLDPGEFAPLIGGSPASGEVLEAGSSKLTVAFIKEYNDRINTEEKRMIEKQSPNLFTTQDGIMLITDIMSRADESTVATANFQDEWLAQSGGRFRVTRQEADELGLGAVSLDKAIRSIQTGKINEDLANIGGSDVIELMSRPVINENLRERLSGLKKFDPEGQKQMLFEKPFTTSGGIEVLPPPPDFPVPQVTEETKGMLWIGITADGKPVYTDGSSNFVMEE